MYNRRYSSLNPSISRAMRDERTTRRPRSAAFTLVLTSGERLTGQVSDGNGYSFNQASLQRWAAGLASDTRVYNRTTVEVDGRVVALTEIYSTEGGM